MTNQEENVSYQQLENCSSIAKECFRNLNDSKMFGTIGVVFNIVLNIVLMFTASPGNGMIIVAILRSQNLHTPSYDLLITSLAFTDLLMGLVYHPLQIAINTYHLQGDVQWNYGMTNVYECFAKYLIVVSLSMVTCNSIDRYLALTLRHRYNIIVTKKRVRLLILLVWFASLFVALPQNTMYKGHDMTFAILVLVLALISIIFSTNSYRSLHSYIVQVQAQQPNPLAGNFDIVRYKKTLKTMLVVLVCFLICSAVPLICVVLARIILTSQTEGFMIFHLVTATLISINSSLNPVIYLVRFADIRHACRETLSNFLHCDICL